MRIALWTHGEGPTTPRAVELTKLCNLVLAADGGLEHLVRNGLKADEFVGDRDSLHWSESQIGEASGKTTFLPADKDDSDTEAAVKIALQHRPEEIWMFGGGGRRMDHWLSNAFLFSKYQELRRWITPWEVVYSLHGGQSLELNCSTVSIFPWGLGPWSISSNGLVWPIDRIDFSEVQSLSNRTTSGMCSLQSSSGLFLVFVPEESV